MEYNALKMDDKTLYFGNKEKLISWEDASALCQHSNGYLPQFTSRDDLLEFVSLIKLSKYFPALEAVYIGLSYNSLNEVSKLSGKDSKPVNLADALQQQQEHIASPGRYFVVTKTLIQLGFHMTQSLFDWNIPVCFLTYLMRKVENENILLCVLCPFPVKLEQPVYI